MVLDDTYFFELGLISCAYLSNGGSMSPGYVLSFYLVKNHKIANNSATTYGIEKIIKCLESFEF
jgi:hypothetical protein